MVRLGGARLRALVSFCTGLSTLLVLPPLFDSNWQDSYITKGVMTMTKFAPTFIIFDPPASAVITDAVLHAPFELAFSPTLIS
jgi:hypothetical protein